jgi:hypothetical protein
MLAIQEAYIVAKKRNKKYTPKKISEIEGRSEVSPPYRLFSAILRLYHSAGRGDTTMLIRAEEAIQRPTVLCGSAAKNADRIAREMGLIVIPVISPVKKARI